MQIIGTCFEKNINSIIMQMPDLEELYDFKKCVRKYARVKMRAVTYYNLLLHKEQDYLESNTSLFLPFL